MCVIQGNLVELKVNHISLTVLILTSLFRPDARRAIVDKTTAFGYRKYLARTSKRSDQMNFLIWSTFRPLPVHVATWHHAQPSYVTAITIPYQMVLVDSLSPICIHRPKGVERNNDAARRYGTASPTVRFIGYSEQP